MWTTLHRRWALAGSAWLATVAVATAVATGAVGSMRQGIFGTSDTPYSEAKVDALLAGATTGPAASPATPPVTPDGTPGQSAAPTAAGSGVVRALTTSAGTIVAVCDVGLVTLRSWTPNSGFETDHVQRGPAAVASLRFKARSGGGDVRAEVTCAGPEPHLTVAGDD
ncbi:hypothetical protein [Dactylosporangium sp. NPDC050588]|uniref:hypothetical protein n=1 Tax=Dactylosporangium sp. NPDC050588 TaxID=3157211 RepID=UPI00340587EF